MLHYTSIKSISKAPSPKHWWPFGIISHCKKGFRSGSWSLSKLDLFLYYINNNTSSGYLHSYFKLFYQPIIHQNYRHKWRISHIVGCRIHLSHIVRCRMCLSHLVECRMHLLVAIWEKVCTLSDKPSKGSDKFMINMDLDWRYLYMQGFFIFINNSKLAHLTVECAWVERKRISIKQYDG